MIEDLEMATLKKRLGASIVLTFLSLVSLLFLLLRHTNLEGSIDQYTDLLWSQNEDDDDLLGWGESGERIVVFGDSWVDDERFGVEGKGKSWTEALCEEIECTSYMNLATSQSPDSFPSQAPLGALVSNNNYITSIARSKQPIDQNTSTTLLPDFAAQIRSYISSTTAAKTAPQETLFVVSFGFWDIYNSASFDGKLAENATNTAIDALFAGLDELYAAFSSSILETKFSKSNTTAPRFRVFLPKILDPSLLPGWLSSRPVPLAPSNVAEHQKNAMYLTQKWNLAVENRLPKWIKEIASPSPSPSPSPVPQTASSDPRYAGIPSASQLQTPKQGADTNPEIRTSASSSTSSQGEHTKTSKKEPEILKDAYYHDLPSHLLDVILEHQMEDEGISDASGLGKAESPYISVYFPCVKDAEDDEDVNAIGMQEMGNGMVVCAEPEDYLWWDAWTLGPRANEGIAREIAEVVGKGKSLRDAMGAAYGNRVGSV